MKKGSFWTILGLLLLAAALVFAVKNMKEDRDAGESSQAVLDELWANIPTGAAEETPASRPTVPDPTAETEFLPPEDVPAFVIDPEIAMPTVTIGRYQYIGVLSFPELKLEFPIMEQWDYGRLKIAPCLYTGSIYQNNAVICGHNYATHFSSLKYAPEGTQAIFTDVDGNRFRYYLAYIDILQPTDVELMTESDGSWDLTVFTCTNGGRTRSTARFKLTEVVYAETETE